MICSDTYGKSLAMRHCYIECSPEGAIKCRKATTSDTSLKYALTYETLLWKDTAYNHIISFSYYCWIRETNPNSFLQELNVKRRSRQAPHFRILYHAVPAQLCNHTKPSLTRTAFRRRVQKYSLLLQHSSCGHCASTATPHSRTTILYRRRIMDEQWTSRKGTRGFPETTPQEAIPRKNYKAGLVSWARTETVSQWREYEGVRNTMTPTWRRDRPQKPATTYQTKVPCPRRQQRSYIFMTNIRPLYIQGGSNMTGTNCDLFTHK